MFSSKNVSKRALKKLALLKLLLANIIVGWFTAGVAHDALVTTGIVVLLVLMTAFVVAFFWLDSPQPESGLITRSQVLRARFRSWLADLEVKLEEAKLFLLHRQAGE